VTDRASRYRLPRTVVPSRYDLEIEPDLPAGTFTGSASIAVTAVEPVSEIVLNAKDLDVLDGRLVDPSGRVFAIDKVVPDVEAERVTLALDEEAIPGAWTLHLSFRGTLNDRLTGFYRSTFTDDDGDDRVIATTHFEATDARMAFPCWDEPDLKAVFGVTLVVAEGLEAFSNGPEVGREPTGDGRIRVRFADTMVMSTYLVCFVVGPLVVTEARDARGVPVRVVCRPGREHLAGFALDAAAFSLDWFADYYGIAYPDAKLDNVALPDFAQGAMENLGCVTYREQLLLLDPTRSTQAERLDVAETIAHELAHMWFGDLVTMRWWNGIWLNEAFATFMSYLCVDAMVPQWRAWDTFLRTRVNAFETDSLETTRAIEYPVASPHDASGMFDTLTYTKGGAVLRMLEQWLGPERFRDGIRRYLALHAHANTETHDLWDALEEESGEPVRRTMDAWIFQPGYPAITVRRDGDVLRFSQRRFIPSDPDDPTVWPVPLIVRQTWTGGERVDRVLVEAGGLELPLVSADGLVVANADGSSFVRTFYDDDLRGRLLERAQADLSPIERQGLVDDTWASVVAQDAPIGTFLDLVAGFGDESELPVWQTILTGLTWCDRFIDGPARDRFRDSVRDLVRPAFDRLGWDVRPGDSDLDRELRGELVRAMGILGDDPETRAQARELEAQARSGVHVEPPVAAAAIDVVATDGGPEELEAFLAWALDAPTPQEQDRYRGALGRFRDPASLGLVLEACLDAIRPQDAGFVLARSLANRDRGAQAWGFVREHWDEITRRLASSNVIALPAGARMLTRPEEVASVQAFFEEHDVPQNHLMLLQFLERQRVLAALRLRAEPELSARFGG
jgi:puromycin-sensitive aminopeptidase